MPFHFYHVCLLVLPLVFLPFVSSPSSIPHRSPPASMLSPSLPHLSLLCSLLLPVQRWLNDAVIQSCSRRYLTVMWPKPAWQHGRGGGGQQQSLAGLCAVTCTCSSASLPPTRHPSLTNTQRPFRACTCPFIFLKIRHQLQMHSIPISNMQPIFFLWLP